MPKHRTIFIWDLQWCYDEFRQLLDKIELKEEDKVYLVWDLINKWPKSYKVLNFVYKNRKQFKSVVWNHEINFLRWLDWLKYSQDKDFKKLKKKIYEKDKLYLIDYIKSLPLYIEEKDFIVLHAGVYPWKKLDDHSIDEITRVREIDSKPWYEYYKWDKKIIYWHWALDWLRLRKNTIWLDSGCVYGKALTAYILETWEVVQQSSSNIYVNVYNNQDYLNWFINKFETSENAFVSRLRRLFNISKNHD